MSASHKKYYFNTYASLKAGTDLHDYCIVENFDIIDYPGQTLEGYVLFAVVDNAEHWIAFHTDLSVLACIQSAVSDFPALIALGE